MAVTDARDSESGVTLQESLAASDFRSVAYQLRRLWIEAPSHAHATLIARHVSDFHEQLGLRTVNVAFLRSFTVEPMLPALISEASAYGVHVRPWT